MSLHRFQLIGNPTHNQYLEIHQMVLTGNWIDHHHPKPIFCCRHQKKGIEFLKLVKWYGNSDFDGGQTGYVFSRKVSVETALKLLGFSIDDDYGNYNGVGRYYSDCPFIVRKGSRMLITVQWGYDC